MMLFEFVLVVVAFVAVVVVFAENDIDLSWQHIKVVVIFLIAELVEEEVRQAVVVDFDEWVFQAKVD